ncbi:hypothetical protein Goshw_023491, partial [Gossypium schwendimanii]|nr:hypothetical protein [Gossypium schwendimanii]
AGFWHVATIGQGCKLDLKLISELVERGRPETHTFYLPCEECTITLGDVQLQLGLLMDRFALTKFIQSTDWGAICYDLLGAILDNIYGGRIEMDWLRDTFLELRNDSTEVERIRYAQAYILEMIRGYLMLDLSRNLVHLRWLLKLVDFRARLLITTTIMGSISLSIFTSLSEPPIYIPTHNEVVIPTVLEDIRLLLDQRSKAQFQWTPYEDPAIRALILNEIFHNLNIWHVKVPLGNYATVEMHQTNSVL